MTPQTLPSGTILNGRYRIERALGSGGFGHVYLVLDQKRNEQYAVKEYLVTGTNGLAQLQHEAQVLSQLHHPNLPVFQNAFSDRDHYYVVISYIEGSDLTDLVRGATRRNEAIPIARLLGWTLTICDAVSFLHSRQPIPIIHRDIKPDNIRIMLDEHAILVDLGNAKEASGERTLLFIRHQGTPGYAPQEQYPGGEGTDERSDVYALGGTLYFALTAEEPPSVSTRNDRMRQNVPDLLSLQELLAKNPPELSAEAAAEKQFRLGVSKPAKPPPRHSRHLAQLGTLPPGLLDQLNRIIRHAMAMRPKDRYPSVAELSADLKRIAAALPGPQPPQAMPLPNNPYSTQPDLPLIYEAINVAKAHTDQKPADAGASPKAKDTSVAPHFCPRCQAPLQQQAAYCPRCGTSLSNTPKGSSSSESSAPPKDPPSKPDTAPPQNRPKAQDISAEPTAVITPQSQMRNSASTPQSSLSVPSRPTPSLSRPPSVSPTSANQLHLPPMPPRQSMTAPQPPSPARSFLPQVSSPPSYNSVKSEAGTDGGSSPQAQSLASQPTGSGLGVGPRTIIITATLVLVVLVLIIILFFLVKRG